MLLNQTNERTGDIRRGQHVECNPWEPDESESEKPIDRAPALHHHCELLVLSTAFSEILVPTEKLVK